MSAMRKVTVNLPAELVDDLPEKAGKTLTEAIRTAVREYRHRLASQRLLAAGGTSKCDETGEELAGTHDDEW